MAQINFRIDDGVKAEAESLFSRLGMNMSTAIMVFIRQSIVENGIPFRIKASSSDYERFGRVNYHYHELPETDNITRRGVRREKAMA